MRKWSLITTLQSMDCISTTKKKGSFGKSNLPVSPRVPEFTYSDCHFVIYRGIDISTSLILMFDNPESQFFNLQASPAHRYSHFSLRLRQRLLKIRESIMAWQGPICTAQLDWALTNNDGDNDVNKEARACMRTARCVFRTSHRSSRKD